MTLEMALFSFFAALTCGSALGMLLTKNILYAALWLMCCLLGVAALYVFAYAPFLAVVQLVLYVGGILVLIVFSLMFTIKVRGQKIIGEVHRSLSGWVIFLVTGIVGFKLIASGDFFFQSIYALPDEWEGRGIKQFGFELLSTHLILLEVIGFLLLWVLVGAIIISRVRIKPSL